MKLSSKISFVYCRGLILHKNYLLPLFLQDEKKRAGKSLKNPYYETTVHEKIVKIFRGGGLTEPATINSSLFKRKYHRESGHGEKIRVQTSRRPDEAFLLSSDMYTSFLPILSI